MPYQTWLARLAHPDPDERRAWLQRWPQAPEAVRADAAPVWRRVEGLAANPTEPPKVREAAWAALQSPAARTFYERYGPSTDVPWLLNYIREWEEEGLLTREQAQILRWRYSARPRGTKGQTREGDARPAWSWGLSLALYLGAFFVLAAALLLAQVFKGLRIPVLMAATAGFGGLAWGLRGRTRRGSWIMALVAYGLLLADAYTWYDVLAARLGRGAWVNAYWAGVYALLAGLAALLAWGYASRLLALLAMAAAWFSALFAADALNLESEWLLWLWALEMGSFLGLSKALWNQRPRPAKTWFIASHIGMTWLLIWGGLLLASSYDSSLARSLAVTHLTLALAFFASRRVRPVPWWDVATFPLAVWLAGLSWGRAMGLAHPRVGADLALLMYSLPVLGAAWAVSRLAWAHPRWPWALVLVAGLQWGQSAEILAVHPGWPWGVRASLSLLVWMLAAVGLGYLATRWASRGLAWLALAYGLRAYAHVLAEIAPGYLRARFASPSPPPPWRHWQWELFNSPPGEARLGWWFAAFVVLALGYGVLQQRWADRRAARAWRGALQGWLGFLGMVLAALAMPGTTWTHVLVGAGLGLVALGYGFREDRAWLTGLGVWVLGWAWSRVQSLLWGRETPLVWSAYPVALALVERWRARRGRAWRGVAYGLLSLVGLASLWALECLARPGGQAGVCGRHSLALAIYASLMGWYAWRWRALWLSVPTAGLYFAAYAILLHALDVRHPQAYSVPAALLGLSLHALFRRAGSRWAAEGLGMLSQLVLFTTTYVQMTQQQNPWYFAVLFFQALVVIGYGVLQQSRSLTWTPVGFLVLGVITVLLQQWRGVGVLLLLGCSGLALLAGGLAFLMRKTGEESKEHEAL